MGLRSSSHRDQGRSIDCSAINANFSYLTLQHSQSHVARRVEDVRCDKRETIRLKKLFQNLDRC